MKTEPNPTDGVTIESLLQELVDQFHSDSSPDIELLCQQHPQLADEIRDVLPTLLMMHNCRPRQNLANSPAAHSFSGRTLGNYRLGKEIGRGGMGVVYEAVQMPLGRRVAIKLLASHSDSAHAKDRFEREFRLAASLHHTHIIPVFDAGESEGQLYFAMQLVEGIGLDKWRHGRQRNSNASSHAAESTARTSLTEPDVKFDHRHASSKNQPAPDRTADTNDFLEIARIGTQVAQAIEHAHQSGIFHRDIKPGNILIDQQEQAWVSDFGLAKPIDSSSITSSGDVVGTLRYLAPERLRGQCDAHSDIYSLGLVLFELVEGEPAFHTLDGPTLLRQLSQPRQLRFSANRQIPADLRTVIEKAVCPHPEQRYQTASALAEDLNRFCQARPILARKPSVIRSAQLWSRRNPMTAGLLATILLVLLTGVTVASILAINWRSSARLATANATEADAERDRTRQSLNLTQLALADMTDGLIVDYLTSRDAMTSEQKAFLDKVLEYNNQMVSLAGSDEQSRAGQAHALGNVASIHQLLGNIGLAEKKIRESISAWRELADDFPETRQYELEGAGSMIDLGRILVTQNGRSTDAMDQFTAARDILLQLPPIAGFDSQIASDLATSHNNIANMLQTQGKLDEAITQYNSAIQLQQSLLNSASDGQKRQSDLARSLNNLAVTLLKAEQIDNAFSTATEALNLRRNLADANPLDAESQLDYQGGLAVMARIFRKKGQLKEAGKYLEDSAVLIRKLADNYPSVPHYRSRLCTLLQELAELNREMNLPDQAELHYAEAINVNEQLVAEVPDHLSYHGWLAETHRNLALLIQGERPADALSHLQSADTEFQAVLEIDPSLRWARHSKVAVLVAQAELLWDRLNEPQSALDIYVRCEELWGSLADDFPDSTQFRSFQGGVQCNVAAIHFELGRADEALIQFDHASEILSMVQQGDAGFEVARRNLYRVYSGKAELYDARQEYAESSGQWQFAETCADTVSTANRCRINRALALARGGRIADASRIAEDVFDSSELTNTQNLYLARVFTVLAAANVETRQSSLETAATILKLVATSDRPSVEALATDSEFAPFWDQIAPK